MFSPSRKMIVALLLCTMLFVAGLAKLFWLRFEAGDLYPPYSSLRGDPLGTQVLYESLKRASASGAQRNFQPLDQTDVPGDSTFLVCGLSGRGAFLKADMWEHLLDRIALNGGRLVISFRTSAKVTRTQSHEPVPCEEEDANETREKDGCIDEGSTSWIGVLATLGLAVKPSEEKTFADFAERFPHATRSLPAIIPWRSPLFFELDDAAWQALYRWEGEPVIVIRPWGAGTVVMASGSYLFSNEALRRDRFPELLAWFVQAPHRVVIDEFHNGLVKQPGIASLMRKYRLHGVLASLVILLVLFMWRQMAVFVTQPADETDDGYDMAAGRETTEGLVGLMQQHIRADDLLEVCYESWRTSTAAVRVPEERMAQISRMVSGYGDNLRHKNLVVVYQQICQLLKQGKHA